MTKQAQNKRKLKKIIGNLLFFNKFIRGAAAIQYLTEEEKIESEKYEDFSEFIETLEDKYGFNLGYCSWMSYEVLSERSY